jgi:hypothetical protein
MTSRAAPTETVTFSIDCAAYEIDLNRKNAKSLRGDVDRWSGAARKASTSRAARRRSAASQPTGEATAIRAWAVGSHMEVPNRGRLPRSVVEQDASDCWPASITRTPQWRGHSSDARRGRWSGWVPLCPRHVLCPI